MKKKLLAAVVLCMVVMLVFCGCQAGLVSSNVTIHADGSGTKTITVVIYGDESILAGEENVEEPGLVGNNSKFLLVSGDELVNKLKSYSALKDLEITTAEADGNTTVTVTYSFSSIDDYVAKTKLLAGDDADRIEAPTFTDNGDGTFLYRENTENTGISLDNIFESLYNDPEAFSMDGQGDCNLESFGYDYTCIYTIMSVSATVGESTTKVDVNEYNESNTVIELDWADYIEVTGTPASASTGDTTPNTTPDTTEPTNGGNQNSGDAENGGLPTGAIVGIVVACVAVVAIVMILVVKKKKA